MIVSFFLNLVFIYGLDWIVNTFFLGTISRFTMGTGIDFGSNNWIAVPAFVLGTLLIVISIASQNIIKLIDLYMQDWISLFYVWFIVLSAVHFIFSAPHSVASQFLNINIFMTMSIVLAFPYIFYILRLTKPEIIISKIKAEIIRNIRFLASHSHALDINLNKTESYQGQLFASLNQFDDLLNYIHFKETKSLILSEFRDVLIFYEQNKSKLPGSLFRITQTMRRDISFRTMFESLKGHEVYDLFFEKKCLRIMGNAYQVFIENNQFDMAALTASEIVQVVKIIPDTTDHKDFLDLILVHLNTLFRFAFKHAVKENEHRNLYNLVYHYRLLMELLIQMKQPDLLQRAFYYLHYYGNECYKQAALANLYFVVDTIAFEMNRILISVYEKNMDKQVQVKLLQYLLEIDKPPEMMEENKSTEDMMISKVRLVQIALALFYLEHEETVFVEMIKEDILDDLKVLGEQKFKQFLEKQFALLKIFEPYYWEDTDRGNINIYYTPYKDRIEAFKNLIFQEFQAR